MSKLNIQFTVDLAQYFKLGKRAGSFHYITISASEREQILAQEGWDSEYAIIPNPLRDGETETRTWQLWEKQEWLANSAKIVQNREIKIAKERKEELIVKNLHDDLIARERRAIKFFTDKGMSLYDARKMIEYAKNPRVITEEIFNEETLEFEKIERQNPQDIKIRDAFKLYL